MSNLGFKGIDIRQTGEIVFECFFQTSSGDKEVLGPVTMTIDEVQSDASFKSFDFADNTFKTGVLGSPSLGMNHQKRNASNDSTGVWTAGIGPGFLNTVTNFTVGAVYIIQYHDAQAAPPDQTRMLQYGGAQGDLTVSQQGIGKALMNTLGGAGSGAFPMGIVVTTNGVTPIVGATVRVSGNQSGLLLSDVNGQVLFGLDPGLVTLTISAPGYYYTSTPQTVSVSGTWVSSLAATLIVTMTANPSITSSSNPNKTNVFFVCRDAALNLKPGITFSFRLVDPLQTTDAWSDSLVQTATSDTNGLVQILLPIAMKWQITGPDNRAYTFTTGTQPTFPLPEFRGRFG